MRRMVEYEEVVEAAGCWLAVHGRLPTQREWDQGMPEHPCSRTIRRRWSWEQVMSDAAGDSAEQIRERELLLALQKARQELGRWPEASKWEHRTKTHATRRTYVRWFGSWEAACRAAGRLRATT